MLWTVVLAIPQECSTKRIREKIGKAGKRPGRCRLRGVSIHPIGSSKEKRDGEKIFKGE